MDWKVVFLGCEVFFIIQCACTSRSPQKHVQVESSVLTWDLPGDQTNVTYTVQYNKTLNDWREVYSGPQRQFEFTASAEDFYGRRFRVQSKRENQTSGWEQSELVQCAHLHTCAPIIKLKVETDKVHLWMEPRDQSLKKKHGGHIKFMSQSWKRNSTDIKEHVELDVNSAHLVLEDLESGQEYCFQVEYLLFDKPYGKPSREICKVIPETSIQRTLRVIMIGVLTVVGLVTMGICMYFIYTHYKRIKELLQPPLVIPGHFEEFFFSEFPEQPVVHPGKQVTESFEFVAFVDAAAEDDGRRNLEHRKEDAGTP